MLEQPRDQVVAELDQAYGDEWHDVTEDVTCYEKGKTFSCRCGQDIGVKFEEGAVSCNSCGTICVDFKSAERGPPERESNQSGLAEWT